MRRPIHPVFRSIVIALIATPLCLAACDPKKSRSDDDDTEAKADDDDRDDTPASSAKTSKPAANGNQPAAAPPGADPDAAVKAFFKSQIEACNVYNVEVGNQKPGERMFDGSKEDPSRTITVLKREPDGRAVVQDAAGTRLVVDVKKRQITGPTGPTGEVPRPYTFCPSSVFVGTMDEAGAQGSAPPPVKITECKAASGSVGSWRPTPEQVTEAASRIPYQTCLEPTQIASALSSCAAAGGGATPEVAVEAAGFSACIHKVRTLDHGGRHFIYVDAFVGVEARFHGQAHIFELRDGQAIPYFHGFSGGSPLCSGGAVTDPRETTPQMQQDWPGLPAAVQNFLCDRSEQPTAGAPPAAPPPAAPPPPPADSCGAAPSFVPAQRTLRLNRFIGSCAQVKAQVDFSIQELKQLLEGQPGGEAWIAKLFTHQFTAGTTMCGFEVRGVDAAAAEQLIRWLRCKQPRACPPRFCRLTRF